MQAQHGRSDQAALTAGSHDGDMQAQSLKLDGNVTTHQKPYEETGKNTTLQGSKSAAELMYPYLWKAREVAAGLTQRINKIQRGQVAIPTSCVAWGAAEQQQCDTTAAVNGGLAVVDNHCCDAR
jgi:hypothetical protein